MRCLALLFAFAAASDDPCAGPLDSFVAAHFASLGLDCEANAALYAPDAVYYHQHYGFRRGPELRANCEQYGRDCAGADGRLGAGCHFLQNGAPKVRAVGGRCHILVEYLWAELPANHRNPGNLEPHTGWEYIVARRGAEGRHGFVTEKFAEVESSYAVPLNRAQPERSPSLFEESTLHLLHLTEKQQGKPVTECDRPLAPFLTAFFQGRCSDKATWRQQDDAVVLAAGGLCHVAAPYSAEVEGELQSGEVLLVLRPANESYALLDAVDFARARPAPPAAALVV